MRLSSIGMVALLAVAFACSQDTNNMDKATPAPAATQAPENHPASKPAETDPAAAAAKAAEAKAAEAKAAAAKAIEAKAPEAKAPEAGAAEPDYIKVQHCLVAFKGSLPKPTVTRTKEEAKTLAYEILEKARKGEDFDALVKQYTDDSPPGIYGMSNLGKPNKPNYYARNRMVPAFGDTGFPLKVGEFGISDYDPKKSPYGWHIVKRIE